jgi:trafficking protein particle complex subunit 3
LLALTYGAFVTKLLKENQHRPVDEVNTLLEKMGYNIGTRIVDEFFAKSPPNRGLCRTFKETVEVVAREGLKIFLGIQGEVNPISPTIHHANPPLQPDSQGQ